MKDKDKTKEQIINKLMQLRQRITKLEKLETEHQRTKEALRQSEEKYRTLAENAMDGFYIITSEGFEYVNPAFEKIFGYTAKEVCSKNFNFYNLIHQEDRKLIAKREESRKKGEKLTPIYGFRIITKDGHIKHVEVNTVPLPGKKARVLGILRDITERKRVEEALCESESKYRFLFEKSPTISLIIGIDGLIKDINKTALENFGYSKDEVIGKPPLGFAVPQHREKVAAAMEKSFKGEHTPEMDVDIYAKDGSVHTILFSPGQVVLYEEDKPTSILVTAIDITERKRADEALRESEERYRTLFQCSGTAISITEEDGTLYLVNKEFEELTGYPQEEIEGKMTIVHFVPEHERKRILHYHQARRKGEMAPDSFKCQLRRKNGETRTVLMTVGLIPGTKLDIGSAIDITEMEKLERELSNSEEKYRTLTDNINVGIYRNTVGPKGKFIEANPAVVKMFGYQSREEFLKLNVADLYQNPADRKKFNEKMLQMGYVRDEELQLKKKDGTPFIGSVSAVAVKDDNGEVLYYDGIIEDITERKRAEKALRESEERYRTLFHHRGTVVVLIEEDGTISMVNKEIEELTGYTEEEIIGNAFVVFDFFPGKEKQRILGYHQARRKGGNAPISYETKIRRKDREIRSVLVNVALIPNTKRSIASIMDITDRKKTEQELKWKSREIRSYARQMKMTYKALEMAYLEMIHALVISVETRDPYTRGHSERVTQYSKEIAKRLGLKEKDLKNLELACRIHDIGKIGISDRILLKDDKLSIAEWAEMKMHPVRGAEMLTFSEFFKPVIPIVRHHHERWDGKGYPDGLKREKIPLGARIMAVSDTFDAMSSSRPYRDAIDLKKIVEELKENAGTQLDPKIVKLWLEIMHK